MILAATLRDPGRLATSAASAQCSLASGSRRATRLQPGLASLPGGSLLLRKFRVTCMPPVLPVCCVGKKSAGQLVDAEAERPLEFSVLLPEVPWDSNDTWTIFAAYFFILHIPLSFGGLSIVAEILHEPNLDPLTIALFSIALQIAESIGALALFKYNVKPQQKFFTFFCRNWSAGERSWISASIFGIGLLAMLVLFTSVIADAIIGPKDINNPILREILLSSSLSRATCFIQYGLVTPLLEETVYRGFLLSSLGSTGKRLQAVIISSFVFSIAHFSAQRKVGAQAAMGGFEKQVKERAKELKHLVKKGVKVVGDSCKKTWHKVRSIRGSHS